MLDITIKNINTAKSCNNSSGFNCGINAQPRLPVQLSFKEGAKTELYAYPLIKNRVISGIPPAPFNIMISKLFPNGLDNISLRQSSSLGDCYFLAGITAILKAFDNEETGKYMAHKYKNKEKFISNIIKKEPDNSYKVTFPEYPDISVTVTKQEAEEGEDVINPKTGQREHIDPVSGDLGMKILERAAAKVFRQLKKSDPGYDLPCLDSGISSDILQLFMGKPARYCWIDRQKKAVSEIFRGNGSYILTASTRKDIDPPDYWKDIIKPKHTYALILNKQRREVRLTDPHNIDMNEEIVINYKDFLKYFSFISAFKLAD